jgi:hypothetical protein
VDKILYWSSLPKPPSTGVFHLSEVNGVEQPFLVAGHHLDQQTVGRGFTNASAHQAENGFHTTVGHQIGVFHHSVLVFDVLGFDPFLQHFLQTLSGTRQPVAAAFQASSRLFHHREPSHAKTSNTVTPKATKDGTLVGESEFETLTNRRIVPVGQQHLILRFVGDA